MAGGSFINPNRGLGSMPDATKFQRRTNHYNTPLTNETVQVQNEDNRFKSLDGRKWSSRDETFAANKEYYTKMTNMGKNNFMK